MDGVSGHEFPYELHVIATDPEETDDLCLQALADFVGIKV